ncbi:MAG: hypothetical protein ACFFEM_01955 [Candidatus Thorarchaeota archaeon]
MSGAFDEPPREGMKLEGQNLVIVVVLVVVFVAVSILMFIILPQILAGIPYYYP